MTHRTLEKRALILACKELDHVRRPGKLAEYLASHGYKVDVQCFTKDPKVKLDNINFTEIQYVSRLEVLYDKYLRFKIHDSKLVAESGSLYAKFITLLILPFFWVLSLIGVLTKWFSPAFYANANAGLIEKLKMSFRRAKNRHFAEAGEALLIESGQRYDLILCHDVYPLVYAAALKERYSATLWLDIVDHPFIRSYMRSDSKETPTAAAQSLFFLNVRKADLIITSLNQLPEFDFGDVPIETISNFHSKRKRCPPMNPVSGVEPNAFVMAGNHFRSTGVLRAISFIENYPQPCSFEIIGRFNRPAYRAEVLSAIKSKGLQNSVTLHPPLTPDELTKKLMEKTAVLVPFDPAHPNLIKVLPNRLFDAMRAMIPVIAQKGTATADWVEAQQVGIATDFFKSDVATEATENYLKEADPLRQAFQSTNEMFNWESEVSKLNPYLKEG